MDMEGNGKSLFDKAIGYRLRIEGPGLGTRQVSMSLAKKEGVVVQEANTELLGLHKRLIRCREYAAVGSLDSRIRSDIRKLALPSPFRTGTYLVPIGVIPDVDTMVEKYRADRDKLVQLLSQAYPSAVEAAKERLGPLFNPTEYPPVDRVIRSFQVEVSYINFGVPDQLKDVSEEIWIREKDRAAASVREVESEVRGVLRAAMLELVQGMLNKLKPAEDGQTKQFRSNALLQDLSQFLGSFDLRNITNDEELQNVVAQARKLMDGVDIDMLKNSDVVADRVRSGMVEIQASLGKMVIQKPKGRQFAWD